MQKQKKNQLFEKLYPVETRKPCAEKKFMEIDYENINIFDFGYFEDIEISKKDIREAKKRMKSYLRKSKKRDKL